MFILPPRAGDLRAEFEALKSYCHSNLVIPTWYITQHHASNFHQASGFYLQMTHTIRTDTLAVNSALPVASSTTKRKGK